MMHSIYYGWTGQEHVRRQRLYGGQLLSIRPSMGQSRARFNTPLQRPTVSELLAFRGPGAKEFPSMRASRLSSLRRQPSSLTKRCSFSFL